MVLTVAVADFQAVAAVAAAQEMVAVVALVVLVPVDVLLFTGGKRIKK